MNNLQQEFNVGDVIEITVTNFATYGVFSDCGQGYKGLIHISNITDGFVKNAQDYFNIGETTKAEVISVDAPNKKIGLSTKKFDLKAKNASFGQQYSQNKKYKRF